MKHAGRHRPGGAKQARAPQHQQGAAILLAMLMVSLVAMLSSAALWQQWRNGEVQGAEYQRLQSSWVLQGTLDWARLILREDAREGATDHLAEPWAIPLQEARLSSFLAAGTGADDTSTDLPDAFMSGHIQDMQGRLNVASLLDGTALHAPTVKAFARLFTALGLPESELALLVQQWQAAWTATGQNGAGRSGATALPALVPRTLAQLRWLGLSSSSIERLEPYVAVLPERTPVNLNTASPIVLHAVIDKLSLADAQRLADARNQTHFKSLLDGAKALGAGDWGLNETQHSVNSRYFRVEGQLRLGSMRVRERTLVLRDGLQVRALGRERLPQGGLAGVFQGAQAPRPPLQ
ncbi:MAG: type II secretion system minor pseudopilin GspK [Rhodoferax sp.]